MPGSSAGGSQAGSAAGKPPSDVDDLLTRPTVQRILDLQKVLPRVKADDPGARLVDEENTEASPPRPMLATDKKAYFEQDLTPRFDEESQRYTWDGTKRVVPSRQVLLSAHQATNGSGCPLSKVRPAQFQATNQTRDTAAIEIYRKLTGDELSSERMLVAEKFIIAKRRASAGELPSPAFKRWLEERPGCVTATAERKSKAGTWKPTNKDGNYKSPYPPESTPAPGSLAAGAAPSGKKSGAFASKTISAGVPNLAKTPWSGHGGVLDVKDEKRNRTPPPNRYDTTILNMTSNTSWRNQPCRRPEDPMAEGSTWEKCKREPVAPTRKAQGYYMFGGSGLHPSPSFMSSTPRESGVFKTSEMKGPLKPVHGCTLRNPRRRPAAQSLEDVAWQAWTCSQDGRSSAAEKRFVTDRMVTQTDGSVVVQPPSVRSPERSVVPPARVQQPCALTQPRPSSAPPRARLDGVWSFMPAEKMPERPPPLLQTCDPYIVRDAFAAIWGFRPIDLFRDMLEDGETQLTKEHFYRGLVVGYGGRAPYLPGAKLKDVYKTFRWFDADAGGSLDIAELDRALRSLKTSRDDALRQQRARTAGGMLVHELSRLGMNVRHLFKVLDTDGDGIITREELHAQLKQLGLQPAATHAEIDILFDHLDPDRSNGIEINELIDALKAAGGRLTKEERRMLLHGPLGNLPRTLAACLKDRGMDFNGMFAVLDVDGDGTITRKELHQQLGKLGVRGSSYEIDVLFDYLDPDHSEGIEVQEFADAIKEVLSDEQNRPKERSGDADFDTTREAQRAKDAARRKQQHELKQRAAKSAASPRAASPPPGEPPPSVPPSAPASVPSTTRPSPRGHAASTVSPVPLTSAPHIVQKASGVSDDELTASLRPIFAELRLEDEVLRCAVAWCRHNGADTLDELMSAGVEHLDELVDALSLKKLKAVNLRKRLTCVSASYGLS